MRSFRQRCPRDFHTGMERSSLIIHPDSLRSGSMLEPIQLACGLVAGTLGSLLLTCRTLSLTGQREVWWVPFPGINITGRRIYAAFVQVS